MAARRPIILLVLVLLLAGCGQDDTVAATLTTAKEAPTTTRATTTIAPTTSTVAPTTTVTMAPTTTTTVTTTPATVPESTTTTIPHVDQVLPGSFGTMGELYARTNPDSLYPLNAQVVNSLGFCEGEEEVAKRGPDAWEWVSVNITHFEGLTVWEAEGGFRAVEMHDRPQMYLAEDGTWYEDEGGEGNPFGFPMEWGDAQFLAASCIEQGAEVVGLDTTAGVATLHIKCQLGGRSRSEPGSADVWISDEGYVMKSFAELFDDPASGIAYVWEVTGLDVEPTGPLPPGW